MSAKLAGSPGDHRRGKKLPGREEGNNQLQIMNHQVENRADVGAAEGIAAGSNRVDEDRTALNRLLQFAVSRPPGGVELLDMTAGQNQSIPVRQVNKRRGVGGAAAERFFDQKMFLFLKYFPADFPMRKGGSGDDCRVDTLQKRFKIVERRDTEFLGDPFSIGRGRIKDSHQGTTGIRGGLLGMKSPQSAGTDDSDSDHPPSFLYKFVNCSCSVWMYYC